MAKDAILLADIAARGPSAIDIPLRAVRPAWAPFGCEAALNANRMRRRAPSQARDWRMPTGAEPIRSVKCCVNKALVSRQIVAVLQQSPYLQQGTNSF